MTALATPLAAALRAVDGHLKQAIGDITDGMPFGGNVDLEHAIAQIEKARSVMDERSALLAEVLEAAEQASDGYWRGDPTAEEQLMDTATDIDMRRLFAAIRAWRSAR